MFETIAITVAVSAAVFLPVGAIYGHSVAAHVSAEASAVKAHVSAEVGEFRAALRKDAQTFAEKL